MKVEGPVEVLLHYWPLVAFIVGLFFSGLVVAIALTMWIMGKLGEQDIRRDLVKEIILKEVRERHHTTMSGMDMRQALTTEAIEEVKDKIAVLDGKMIRIETLVLNGSAKHQT